MWINKIKNKLDILNIEIEEAKRSRERILYELKNTCLYDADDLQKTYKYLCSKIWRKTKQINKINNDIAQYNIEKDNYEKYKEKYENINNSDIINT